MAGGESWALGVGGGGGGGGGGGLFTKITGFLVVSFRKEIFVFWYLLKCELTSDGCQYLFVLCGPWYFCS